MAVRYIKTLSYVSIVVVFFMATQEVCARPETSSYTVKIVNTSGSEIACMVTDKGNENYWSNHHHGVLPYSETCIFAEPSVFGSQEVSMPPNPSTRCTLTEPRKVHIMCGHPVGPSYRNAKSWNDVKNGKTITY